MAMTAAISLSSSTTQTNGPIGVCVTITNGGGTAVGVSQVTPTAVPSGQTKNSAGGAIGVPLPGANTQVSAGGSVKFAWQFVPQAPKANYLLAEPNSFAYDLGALVYGNDGTLIAATTSTLTVTYPIH